MKNKHFLGMLVMIFLVMFAVVLPQPLAANFLQNERSLTLSQIGQLGSLGALGSVIIMLVFGHLQPGIAMMVGQVGVMLFAFLLWRGNGIIWFGLAYIFLGGFRFVRAMTVALVRPLVRDREVGLAFGIVESLNSLAFMAAPVLAGVLYDWRPISIFPISVGILGLTLLMSLVLVRRNRRQVFAQVNLHQIDLEETNDD